MKKKIFSIALAMACILIVSTSFAAANASPVSKKGYTVQSVIDGRESTTAYNKNGKWVYTIQQYSPDNLDNNIVQKVRSVYADYGVTAIQKIEQPGQDAVYIVRLENTKSLKTVRLSNGEIELMQNFIKR
jgi:hypothetical protein